MFVQKATSSHDESIFSWNSVFDGILGPFSASSSPQILLLQRITHFSFGHSIIRVWWLKLLQHSWRHLDFQLSKVHSIIELCKEVQVGMNYSKCPSLWMFLQDKMSWGQMYGEMMVYKENVYVNWHYEKFGLAFVIKQNWTTFGEEKDQEFLHSFKFLEQKVYLVYSWIQKPTTFTLISSSFVFLTHTAIWFERKNVKRQKVNESVQVLRSVHSSLTPSMLTAGEVLSQTQTGSWEFSSTNIF